MLGGCGSAVAAVAVLLLGGVVAVRALASVPTFLLVSNWLRLSMVLHIFVTNWS